MPYVRGYWPALIQLKPKQAEKQIVAAINKAGTIKAAAAAMGISRETLYKYIHRLDISTPMRERRGACRRCGCTEEKACPEGCWWVVGDVCSSCATPAELGQQGKKWASEIRGRTEP